MKSGFVQSIFTHTSSAGNSKVGNVIFLLQSSPHLLISFVPKLNLTQSSAKGVAGLHGKLVALILLATFNVALGGCSGGCGDNALLCYGNNSYTTQRELTVGSVVHYQAKSHYVPRSQVVAAI